MILDSSVAITAERAGNRVEDLLSAIRAIAGSAEEVALSVVSVLELEHGIWRARDPLREIGRASCRERVYVLV